MHPARRSLPTACLFLLVAVILPACEAGSQASEAEGQKQESAVNPSSELTTEQLPFVEGQAVPLPAPQRSGGMPLMEALSERRSHRIFRSDPLPLSLLSELLWAANGENRPEKGLRTAPTARNWQNLDVFVATASGVFRYQPSGHQLVPYLAVDLRSATGKQDFPAKVPLALIYVSDRTKMAQSEHEQQLLYEGVHAGFVSQNVYLFAASAGLATVIIGYFDRPALNASLALPPSSSVVFTQSVGYPQ